MQKGFSRRLLDWYGKVRRDLPWRASNDPYAIWVSEIMLQQTRVATALPYYQRWMERFPTVEALAAAREQDVLHLWSGLGYYSRARNLHRAAKEMRGVFPQDYAAIRELPGIGDYTAAAIASIAFDQPHAAVDGNVLRVIARIADDAGDIAAAGTRQRLAAEAAGLLDRRRPGDFNQAMMELGATVCVPRNPNCGACPVTRWCKSRANGRQHELPVKLRRTETARIARTLLLVRESGRILFWQRPADATRLAGFWELPEAEHVPRAILGARIGEFRHSITNHQYLFTICEGFVNSAPDGLRWLRPVRIKYLFSTTTRKALQ